MLALALQDRASEPPCPFSTPSRVDAFRVELPGDIAKPNAVGLRRDQPSDDLLNAGQRSQHPASFVGELVRQLIAIRRRPKRDSLRLHLLQRRARPLGDHRSCNLVIVREIHKSRTRLQGTIPGHDSRARLQSTTTGHNCTYKLLTDAVSRLELRDIYGAKALSSAVREVFGARSLIQRCRVHKQRNFAELLAKDRTPSVEHMRQQTYQSHDGVAAKKQLTLRASDQHLGLVRTYQAA